MCEVGSILERFNICESIPINQRLQITRVFIFDDRKGVNILFVTKDDKVYGLGSNCYGSVGLGHNCLVDRPAIINELCDQQIVEFKNGLNYAMAIADNGDLYGWGDNTWGQLGRGFVSPDNKYLRPSKIIYFDKHDVNMFSCGKFHNIVVTKSDQMFAWGDNRVGQIGVDDDELKYSPTPMELIKFGLIKTSKVTSVVCSYNRSFCLLMDGSVYSWGENMWRELGHELEQNETLFFPKLINLHNIVAVCPSHRNVYFLNKDGCVYFCGRDESEPTLQSENEKYQYVPRMLNRKQHFDGVHQIACYRKYSAVSVALSNGRVYEMFGNTIVKTNSTSVFSFYQKEYQLSHKTIECDENVEECVEQLNDSTQFANKAPKSSTSSYSDSGIHDRLSAEASTMLDHGSGEGHVTSGEEDRIKIQSLTDDTFFEGRHEKVNVIGRGGFGEVIKVKDKFDKQYYSIKIIEARDNQTRFYLRIMNELEIMAKLNSDYVVNYKNSWVDTKGRFFIKMEYCVDNLQNVINMKADAFTRKAGDSMIAIEYFFSCEIFRELLDCVRYLHQSDPPLIHRDLKPANILITMDSRSGRFLKLCDFGLATFHDRTYMEHTQALGSWKYIAPEVSQGRIYDTRADVFSVGIIAEDIFAFDFNNTDLNDHSYEKLLQDKFKKLGTLVISMLVTRYKQRPSCDFVLKQFQDFSFTGQSVKGSQSFDSIVKRLRDYENPFFSAFLSNKLS